MHCRFTPTCSVYAQEAVMVYGPIKGLYLAIRRVLRCHPFAHGGYDPVDVRGHEHDRMLANERKHDKTNV